MLQCTAVTVSFGVFLFQIKLSKHVHVTRLRLSVSVEKLIDTLRIHRRAAQ